MSDAPTTTATDRYADLLDRATRRLRADPELRLEVAQELRGHLADSAAEYRAAGLGEDEAAAKAAEALGDADAFADQLWHANRRRMRTRTAVRWAVGVVAAPAAAAVCYSLAWGVLTTLALLAPLIGVSSVPDQGVRTPRLPDVPAPRHLSRDAWDDLLERLPSDDRLLITGTSGDREAWDYLGRDAVAGARAIADRWPNDPVLYANYVIISLTATNDEGELTPETLDDMLVRIDRGARLEPDNGLYPLLKAAALLRVSSKVRYDDPDPIGYPTTDTKGRTWQETFPPVDVTDPATFERGLAALREAAGKPYIDAHVGDVLRRRLERFPAARGLNDYLLRQLFTISTLLPHLHQYSEVVVRAGTYAIDLARRGDAERAGAILRDEDRIGGMLMLRPAFAVELLAGYGIVNTVDSQRTMASRLLGREQDFEDARARVEARTKEMQSIRRPRAVAEVDGRTQVAPGAGFVQANSVLPGADGGRIDYAPGRRAEYMLADQLAVAGMIAVLLVLAAAAWAGGRTARQRASRAAGLPRAAPAALFIGWRRLARVVLLGAALPVALYLVLANATPLGGRGRGIWATWPRVQLEYLALGCMVVVLLRALIARAVQRRVAELGLSIAPGPGASRAGGGMAVMAALATIAACLIAWWLGMERAGPAPVSPLLVLLGITLPVAVGFGRVARPGNSVILNTGGAATAPKAEAAESSTLRRAARMNLPVTTLAAVLAAVAVFCLLQALPGPRNPPADVAYRRTVYAVVAISLALTAGAWLIASLAGGAWRSGRANRPGGVVIPWWQLTARSSVVAYAATALFLGTLGAAALRWEERRLVTQFDAAGYSFLDEINRSRLQLIRDRAAAELAQGDVHAPTTQAR